ncbi:unnamed protein product [Closterium sp. NIES-65]|nr:unnamed protein product [Closterium sp. NIES-65]
MEVKVFSDPNLEFTMVRARGDTHMVLRNVLLGYSPERLRSTLLAGTTDVGQPWLSDIRLFHRLKDPYDDYAYSQLLGLPVAAEGDVGFERIPAFLWLPGQEDPVLLNISSHSCSWTHDVEVWTCSLCDFDCGLALDSAMYHIASEIHRKRLQESAHLPAVKEKYGAWRVSTPLQHPRISAFLQ